MAEERNDVDETAEGSAGSGSALNRRDDLAVKTDSSDDSDVKSESESPEQIKERIEETRHQMGETIDAIQDRLSYSNLSEQVSDHVNNAVETAKDAVYDATIGKAATIMKNITNELGESSVVQTVKSNPLPFILIGAGAGLLFYQSYNRSDSKDMSVYRRNRVGTGLTSGLANSTSQEQSGTGKLNDAAEAVTGAAGDAYGAVSGAVSSVYTGAGDVVGKAYDKVGQIGHTARESYDTYIEDNPLAVGAMALAMGAAVGFAIPATNYEGQVFGNARQKLMDTAESTATNLMDRTKEVVTEAGRSIQDQVSTDTAH